MKGNPSSKFVSSIAATVAAVMLCSVAPKANAGTYTWYPDDKAVGNWNFADANWDDGTTAGVAWQDGNDAAFSMGRQRTITVSAPIKAADITMSGGNAIYFTGTGPLSWTGWAKHISERNTYFQGPLVDDGNGLHFDVNGPMYLQVANLHTGGTFIKNSKWQMRPLFIDGPGDGTDLALGPVPASVCTNLVVEDGVYVYLSVNEPSLDLSMHPNRTILMRATKHLKVSPRGILRIRGSIVAENKSGSSYPLESRVYATADQTSGCTVLYGTNYFGKLRVDGKMEIADGRTQVITQSAATGDSAALLVYGNGSGYLDTHGHLTISGGELVNNQTSYRFQTSNYGHLDVAGGTVTIYSGEFLNGMGSPGKTTIRDGGMMVCDKFRLSQTTAGDGGELVLGKNGTIRTRQIGLDFSEARKGKVHFNGGAIQSIGGIGTPVTQDPGNANWSGCDFVVEAGGAVLDTTYYNNSVSFGRPLLSGVAEGETDGGLKCILKGGASVILTCAGHTYNGPTRLEGGNGMLQSRVANAIPATTTLQLSSGTEVGFHDTFDSSGSDLAQTVSRVEGIGKVVYNSLLTVTNGVSPAIDGTYGTLTFQKPCSLSGEYTVVFDANGCGRLKFESAGQDISGLTIALDESKFDRNAPRGAYQILEAPNGYTGRFAVAEPWGVRYTENAAYLEYHSPTVVIMR